MRWGLFLPFNYETLFTPCGVRSCLLHCCCRIGTTDFANAEHRKCRMAKATRKKSVT